MSIRAEIARAALKVMFGLKYKFKREFVDFDPSRKEPYFMIFNHSQLHDAFFVETPLKYFPYPVASNLIYTNYWIKLGMTRIIKSIPIRKGQSDLKALKNILKAFNQDSRGIMVSPEGNSSLYGKETITDYISTAKLVKKLKKDLVIAEVNGGFFAAPRWGKVRRGSVIEITYRRIVKKEDYDSLTIEEIAKIMEEHIAFNDYKWNHERGFIYPSKHLAFGLNRVIYACPHCKSIQTIQARRNDIECSACKQKIHMNPYQLFENAPFKTLIDWDRFQKKELVKYQDRVFYTKGFLYNLNLLQLKRRPVGWIKAVLTKEELLVQSKKVSLNFKLNQIEGIVYTEKNKLSFDYGEDTYLIKMDDPILFLDMIRLHKGETL